jgi:hypothetical protein
LNTISRRREAEQVKLYAHVSYAHDSAACRGEGHLLNLSGYSLRLKFPSMSVEKRQRLQELALKFATLKGTSQDHTAFRLA